MDDLIRRADAIAAVRYGKDPIKNLEALPGVGWIPVAERLPQEDEPVWALCDIVQVLLDNGKVTAGFCNRSRKKWFYIGDDSAEFEGVDIDEAPVVAWQPLAEPPKEVE